MTTRNLCLAVLVTAATLYGQLDVPRIGMVRDAAGDLRAVTGVAGSFALPPAFGLNALSGEFSGLAGVWQLSDRLVMTAPDGTETGSRPAAGGSIVVAFSPGGGSGVVWLAASGELLQFPGWRELDPPDWNGDPLSLAVSRTRLTAVVRRDDGLWLVDSPLAGGRVLRQRLLPGVEPPVLLANDGTLVHAEDAAVMITSRDGTEQRVPVNARPTAFERMGDGWVAVRVEGTIYALRMATLDLWRLPAAAGNTGRNQ